MVSIQVSKCMELRPVILLMGEIWLTSWDVGNPVNDAKNYLSTGASINSMFSWSLATWNCDIQSSYFNPFDPSFWHIWSYQLDRCVLCQLRLFWGFFMLFPFQHYTPGTYPRPSTNSLWRNSFHWGFWWVWGDTLGPLCFSHDLPSFVCFQSAVFSGSGKLLPKRPTTLRCVSWTDFHGPLLRFFCLCTVSGMSLKKMSTLATDKVQFGYTVSQKKLIGCNLSITSWYNLMNVT